MAAVEVRGDTGTGARAGVAESAAGPDTATRTGFADCVEHAMNAINSPSIANAEIVASFCWRDQDESMFPEMLWFVG